MNKDIALGIDIGGTKIFYGLVNSKGEIKGEITKEATPKTLYEIENTLKKIIQKFFGKVEICGIATAGAVNNENSKIISSTANMPKGYSDIDFKNLSFDIKVYVENDANCAAIAEHRIGAGKECKNMVVLTLGTGVGGGIIVDNKLLKGKSGAAGEMHFKMSFDNKRQCTCGAYDCFEVYASGLGLKLTYKDITGQEISTYEITEKFKNGDSSAKLALEKWNGYIAIGILGLNNIFDAEIFALTGSMAQFADIKTIEEYVNKNTVTTKTKVELCAAGNYAGLIGAALAAFEKDKTQCFYSAPTRL